MHEIKIEDVYEDFRKDKKMFDCGNCSAKTKYYHEWWFKQISCH